MRLSLVAEATPPGPGRALAWAVAASLLLHALALFFPQQEPSRPRTSANSRFTARLSTPPAESPPPPAPASVAPTPKTAARPAVKPARNETPRRRVLTVPKSAAPAAADTPRWSATEKQEMNRFLDELANEAKAAPRPSLAQRSLAMARETARHQARQDEEGRALLERRPHTPPPEPFSLDLYVDGVVKRLNRSAAFVRHDPRSRGVKNAAVQFRIHPDGSLKSFTVLNAGDQEQKIAFIRSVVERAIPFARFPPDLDRAARSLGVTICIQPSGGGGFGFTRVADGRPC
ncbi:hypothetical protein [Accumulibacter sp.]|uniref:hypothetical protein n=1 Tax=Accumulibacter sp. TaxID=2053492 RepID=UPI00262911F4|nr:hypothetical protein [Accumulibacter sp.]